MTSTVRTATVEVHTRQIRCQLRQVHIYKHTLSHTHTHTHKNIKSSYLYLSVCECVKGGKGSRMCLRLEVLHVSDVCVCVCVYVCVCVCVCVWFSSPASCSLNTNHYYWQRACLLISPLTDEYKHIIPRSQCDSLNVSFCNKPTIQIYKDIQQTTIYDE